LATTTRRTDSAIAAVNFVGSSKGGSCADSSNYTSDFGVAVSISKYALLVSRGYHAIMLPEKEEHRHLVPEYRLGLPPEAAKGPLQPRCLAKIVFFMSRRLDRT